jgi:hypothetical protein
VQYEEDCASMCIEMCPQCQAYSYAPLPTNYQRSVSPTNCWIWTRNLTTLKEEYTNWDHYRRLIVLVDKSDIGMYPYAYDDSLKTHFNFFPLKLDIFVTVCEDEVSFYSLLQHQLQELVSLVV